jgi:molybdopterin/thiamine biosynthesis adenylyltransferase
MTPITRCPDPALAGARVCLVGLGGLGAPVAVALASAGVGVLHLVDPDTVEVSNLHRQPLYETADTGRPKVDVAGERLHALAPAVTVHRWRRRFTAADAELLRGVDVVVDGTDTIAAKFAVNDAAVTAGVPLVHAGVLGLRAQVLTVMPGPSACYRCVFEEAPPPGDVPSCQEAGVLGPVAALAAALQAAETLRLLRGAPPAFVGRLLVADLGSGRTRLVPLAPNPQCPACRAAPRRGVVGRSAVP